MPDPADTTEEDATEIPDEVTDADATTDPPDEPVDVVDDPADTAATFPREYVEKLRKENAGYRERAGQADALAARLHTTLVTATGRLADPTDLPFDAAHLDDPEALTEAIDALLARKPHLASRRVGGDIGQGAGGPATAGVDLAGLLRSRT